MAPSTISHSILTLNLYTLQIPLHLGHAVQIAAEHTSERLLILVFCDLFNSDSAISHTGSWHALQRLLTYLYAEATKIAQEKDRLLMEVDVLLKGLDTQVALDVESGWEHLFRAEGNDVELSLPSWANSLPTTRLYAQSHLAKGPRTISAKDDSPLPSTYPTVVLGGTFDHLHAGHKMLLSMAAWIANERIIVGVTDDILLHKKSNREVLESLSVRVERVRKFLAVFKPGLVYEVVPIDNVYGPTAVDPNIQALVVSKETLNGATAIAKHREENSLPALQCFVIDVISATSANSVCDDMETLAQLKLSSTTIREWIVRNRAKGDSNMRPKE